MVTPQIHLPKWQDLGDLFGSPKANPASLGNRMLPQP
jgi:hypothetical protein